MKQGKSFREIFEEGFDWGFLVGSIYGQFVCCKMIQSIPFEKGRDYYIDDEHFLVLSSTEEGLNSTEAFELMLMQTYEKMKKEGTFPPPITFEDCQSMIEECLEKKLKELEDEQED